MNLFRVFSILLVFRASGLAPCAAAADPAWNAVLANVIALETEKEAATAHEIYWVDTVTEIRNAEGGLERKIESKRRVTRQGSEPSQVEYLEMKVNGKELSPEEREAEIAKSGGNLEGKTPFAPGEPDKYVFEPAGTTVTAGYPVWVVAFHPKKPDKTLAVGKAFIHQGHSNLVRMEFATSVLPSAVQSMNAAINFRPQAGYWLPSDLTMDLHIKVAFIITLAEKKIHVTETYYGYQARPGP